MDVLLTVAVPDKPQFDVLVAANGSASVRALVDAVGQRTAETFGLHLPEGQAWAARVERTGMLLDGAATVSQAGLLTGDVLHFGTQPASTVATPSSGPVRGARLLVVGGRLLGLSFTVPPGSHSVGRARGNAIVLADSSISRAHFTLHVGERIEVEDAGSLNGVLLSGERVRGRAVVDPDAIIEAGDYAFRVIPADAEIDSPTAQGVIPFNRPPRVDKPYPGRHFEVPQPPNDPQKMRLPWIQALIPLVMAGAMVAVVGSATYLLFGLMSPAMVLGSYLEQKRTSKKDYIDAVAHFKQKMQKLLEEMYDEQLAELAIRHRQSPEPAELLARISELRPELYERSADDDDFLSLRVGLADLPSGVTFDFKDGGSETLRVEVDRQLERFGVAHNVPALVPLRELGGVGVAGSHDSARALARWLITQAVSLHSPADLTICSAVGGERIKEWDWLKWLPHTRCVTSPVEVPHLACTEAGAQDLVEDLLRVMHERSETHSGAIDQAPPTPAILVIFDEYEPLARPQLTTLLTKGPAQGIYFLWAGTDPTQIPHFCGAVAEVAHDGSSVSLRFATDGTQVVPVSFEGLSLEDTSVHIRRLGPVVDNSVPLTKDAGVPRSVPLIDLLGGKPILTDPGAVQHRWANSTELRAPLGATGRGELALCMRSDGPHGLVAGTTGAGKSELLQSYVASLAASHPPTKLTFILVDYKGGAAFKECKDLPHTVGFVTDLNTHLVRRALTSLNAEVTRREHILGAAGAKDLRDMERKYRPGRIVPPPNLLIVVDEFAALAKEVPEFVAGMVDVAQRGRSLGMHLILATQRPAGVVTDNIRANTNLRIALRVAEEAESADVIGTKSAHKIEVNTPGRAFTRIGSNDPVQFQAGYIGGYSLSAVAAPEVGVGEFDFEGATSLVIERPQIDPATAGDTDLVALVKNIDQARIAAGMEIPRTPLLDPLALVIDLASLPERAPKSVSFADVHTPDAGPAPDAAEVAASQPAVAAAPAPPPPVEGSRLRGLAPAGANGGSPAEGRVGLVGAGIPGNGADSATGVPVPAAPTGAASGPAPKLRGAIARERVDAALRGTMGGGVRPTVLAPPSHTSARAAASAPAAFDGGTTIDSTAPPVPPAPADGGPTAAGMGPPAEPIFPDHELVLGMVDRPEQQSQEVWTLDLDRDGSLIIFGTGGSGKTVALRTLAAAIARLTSPAGVNIFGLDFASRGLSALSALPHVSSVLTAEDTEQVMRLFRMLQQRINLRRNLLAAIGASNLTEYRSLCPDGPEQERLVILLDSYAGFMATYEKIQGGELLDIFPRLVADGRSVGVHFVITGDRRGALPSAVLGVVTRRLVLRMASLDEYSNVGLDTRTVDIEAPAGRALADGYEVQLALVGDDQSGEGQQRALEALGKELRAKYRTIAPPVGLLPDDVSLDAIPPASTPFTAMFGIGDNDLAPTGLDLNEANVLVSGPGRSGRTTALAAITLSLGRLPRPPDLYLISARRRELVPVAPWKKVAIGDADGGQLLEELNSTLESATSLPNEIVIVVDDLTDLTDGDTDRALQNTIRLGRDLPIRVVAAGENTGLRRGGYGTTGDLKKDKTGILLMPDMEMDADILGARLPRRAVLRFPVGRGFIVRRGNHELFQVALPSKGGGAPR